MEFVQPADFGHQLKTKLGKSTHRDVSGFCNLLINQLLWAPPVRNMPGGANAQSQLTHAHGAVDRRAAADLVSNPGGANAAGTIVIFIVGEKHGIGTANDSARAANMIQRFNGDADPLSCLLIEERVKLNVQTVKQKTLTYTNFFYASENDICADMFSETQRSAAIAAYAALCAAGGDQSKSSKIIITFGENHIEDIRLAFEYIVAHNTTMPWLKFRPRVYHMMNSHY